MWNAFLQESLAEAGGFQQSHVDTSVHDKGSSALTIYIDDVLSIGPDQEHTLALLASRFAPDSTKAVTMAAEAAAPLRTHCSPSEFKLVEAVPLGTSAPASEVILSLKWCQAWVDAPYLEEIFQLLKDNPLELHGPGGSTLIPGTNPPSAGTRFDDHPVMVLGGFRIKGYKANERTFKDIWEHYQTMEYKCLKDYLPLISFQMFGAVRFELEMVYEWQHVQKLLQN